MPEVIEQAFWAGIFRAAKCYISHDPRGHVFTSELHGRVSIGDEWTNVNWSPETNELTGHLMDVDDATLCAFLKMNPKAGFSLSGSADQIAIDADGLPEQKKAFNRNTFIVPTVITKCYSFDLVWSPSVPGCHIIELY
jgi:hypothetical protein